MPRANTSRRHRTAKHPPTNTPENSNYHSTAGNDFREVLGLTDDKEGFELFKKHLRNVIEKDLDWNLHWHEQTDATWENVDSKLQELVPSINETDERKRATRRYMATYFRNTRWNMKEKLVEDRENSPTGSNGGERGSQSAQHAPVQTPSASVHRPKRKAASKPLKRSTSQNDEPLTNVTSMANKQKRRSSRNVPVSRDRLLSESSLPTDDSPSDGAIRDFLRACQPSLEHLMPVFTKSTMDVKSLSLAFQIAEQYEAMIADKAGSGPQ